MTLTVTTEPLENRQMALNVAVDDARVEKHLRRAARKLARDYRIPGFRKGKAPYQIVVQYFGEQALYNEILDDLGQEIYREALEQAEVEPYGQASLADVDFNPLTYRLIVPLEPTVDLGDYRNVRVAEEETAINEDLVDQELEKYREEYAGWQEVGRPVQYEDAVNIDVKSVIAATDDADEIVVLDEEDWDITPSEEAPMEPAGFDEQLVGMEAGDEKEFDLSWAEDSRSIYAGKTAHYTVKVNRVEAYEKPELDDDFAQLVGPDYATLDDLREDIRSSLREQAEGNARDAYVGRALDAILEQATLEYPPTVVEDQIDAMVREYGSQLRQYGIEDLENFFEQTGQDMDEYREGLREQAEIAARRNLILSELLAKEYIRVDDEDLDARVAEILGDELADAIEELALEEAVAEDLVAGEEALEEAVADELAEEELAVEEAVADALTAEELALEEAVADELITEDPAVAEAVAEDLIAEELAVEAAAADELAAEELALEEAVAQELATEEDALEEATAAELAAELAEELDALSAQRDSMRDFFRYGQGRMLLESEILQRKTLDRLLAIVRGEDVPALDELKAAAEAAGAETESADEDESDASDAEAVVAEIVEAGAETDAAGDQEAAAEAGDEEESS
ncbi:MAG: trigger factor [Caldilineaceae bacterium]|nr:trigger factor [Caldilineaceae bacterium]